MLELSMTLKINPKDFRSQEFSLVIINETSGVENRDIHLYVLQEIFEQGIKIEIPNTICQRGHSLGVLFFIGKEPRIPKKIPPNREGKGIFFSAIGKVKSKEDYEGDKSLVEIQFTQFDKHTWDHIFQTIREKREQITGHFELLRIKESGE